MRIIDALVGRAPAYRKLLTEWQKSLERIKTLDKLLYEETQHGFNLLDHQREFTNEITKLREQLKEYVPKDVHLQVVETADRLWFLNERLRFLNETGETLIRTLQQRIYDLEHPTIVGVSSWMPEDDTPPKRKQRNSTKKIVIDEFPVKGSKVRRVVAKKAKKPLSILRGKHTKK
jgi:hypothetical protein